MPDRNTTIDIAKGILILLVVWGHSSIYFTKYIYWFHMPAFFMISGLFVKDHRTWKQGRSYLIGKSIQYATLYTSYFAVLLLLRLVYTNWSDMDFPKAALKFIIGGRFVGAELGTFWFLTCLFFSIMLFTLILTFANGLKSQLIVLAALYMLAHTQSYLQSHYGFIAFVPWSIDASLLGVCYMAIGYHFRDGILSLIADNRLRIALLSAAFFISFLLILADTIGLTDFRFNMKDIGYNSIAGDLFVPIVFSVLIVTLSASIEKLGLAPAFCWFGYYSVTIMLLHMGVFEVYRHFFSYNGIALFFLGSFIPLIAAYIFDKTRLTRVLFIRGYSKKLLVGTMREETKPC